MGAKRGAWFDHERGEGGGLLHLVAREHGVGIADAMRIAQRDYLGGAVVPTPRPRSAALPADDTMRSRNVLAIWREARPIAGTPAEVHLRHRGMDIDALPARIDDVLRWHPSCPWRDGRHGAMIALWTNAITAEPSGGIHRTAITPAGEKIDRMSPWPYQGLRDSALARRCRRACSRARRRSRDDIGGGNARCASRHASTARLGGR